MGPDVSATVKEMNILSMHSFFEDQVFTGLWLHSHKSQRNANHSAARKHLFEFFVNRPRRKGVIPGRVRGKDKREHSLGELVRWAYELV